MKTISNVIKCTLIYLVLFSVECYCSQAYNVIGIDNYNANVESKIEIVRTLDDEKKLLDKRERDNCLCIPEVKEGDYSQMICLRNCKVVKTIGLEHSKGNCYNQYGTIAMVIDECDIRHAYNKIEPFICPIHGSLSVSLCHALMTTRKIIAMMLTYLVVYFMRSPFRVMFHIAGMFIMRILKFKNCQRCGSPIHWAHTCNNNMLNKSFYTLFLLLTIIISGVTAAPRTTNYDNYIDKTVISVRDNENRVQIFSNDLYSMKVTVLSSHMELKLMKMHEVHNVTSEKIVDETFSCHSEHECIKSLKGDTESYWSLTDPALNLNICPFRSIRKCGRCEVSTIKRGTVYRISDMNPMIKMEIDINSVKSTHYIKTFDENIAMGIFTTKPLLKRDVDFKTVFRVADKIYKGNICKRPSLSCFGATIVKEGQLIAELDPNVEFTDGELKLNRCLKEYDDNIQLLDEIQTATTNDIMVIDYDFGIIELVTDDRILSSSEDCKSAPIKVNKDTVKGCYNCENGFTFTVQKVHDGCISVYCKNEISSDHIFIRSKEDPKGEIHLSSRSRRTTVECNGKSIEFELPAVNYEQIRHNGVRDVINGSNGFFGDFFHGFDINLGIMSFLSRVEHFLVLLFIVLVIGFVIKTLHDDAIKLRTKLA